MRLEVDWVMLVAIVAQASGHKQVEKFAGRFFSFFLRLSPETPSCILVVGCEVVGGSHV